MHAEGSTPGFLIMEITGLMHFVNIVGAQLKPNGSAIH
jgi:hypothetical protein